MASIYDKRILSGQDLEKIENLNREWQNTRDATKKQRLHDSAEQIRALYGYSGGADGSEYIINNAGIAAGAGAFADYKNAVGAAAAAQDKAYADAVAGIESDGERRLREAYIKNMQDSLGIGQRLRDAGLSGGVTESTLAYMNNSYNTARNDIIEDTLDNKAQARGDAQKAKLELEADLARAALDSASTRAQMLMQAQNAANELELAERELEYKKEQDEREFEFKKLTDERDFNYKKEQDAQAAEKKKASSSASTSSAYKQASSQNPANLTVSNVISLIKAGAYDEKFAGILGISDEEVRAMSKSYSETDKRKAAWDLLENGVYDESFPELLGYSEDVLLEYVNSFLRGY